MTLGLRIDRDLLYGNIQKISNLDENIEVFGYVDIGFSQIVGGAVVGTRQCNLLQRQISFRERNAPIVSRLSEIHV